jgi:hypothetical protein
MTGLPSALPRLCLALAAGCALATVGASAATAAPATDALGFVDSTARCTAPATAVVFGRTDSSRVAVCENADGTYTYRGVRVRDGAKLILAATRSGDEFTAESAGATYTVSAKALLVSIGEKVIRDEPMVEFHGPGSTASSPGTSPEEPATPSTPLPPPLPAEEGHAG